MVDTAILFSNMKSPSQETTCWPQNSFSDFPTDQTFHQFYDLIPSLTFTELRVVSMEHLQRLWHVNGKRLPSEHLVTSLFGACVCSDRRDQISQIYINFMSFIRTWSPNYEWFPLSICDGCYMPAWGAYPSGHPVPSPLLGLACAPIVDTSLTELAVSFVDFSPWIPLGTFSILLLPLRKWKVGCTWAAHVLHLGCTLKQWAAQWTGAAHYLCKLIIISARVLHIGSSVGRSCPLTFNFIIISDHGQLRLLDYKMGSSVGSSNLITEKVGGSGQLQHRLSSCLWIITTH